MKTYLELKAEWEAATKGTTALERVSALVLHGLKLKPAKAGTEEVFKISFDPGYLFEHHLSYIAQSETGDLEPDVAVPQLEVELREVKKDVLCSILSQPAANCHELALAA
ncbi:MAG: hypothetical protein V4675_15055 [Verrucomicrobiota bacterium]